jgi:hypothetical protein
MQRSIVITLGILALAGCQKKPAETAAAAGGEAAKPAVANATASLGMRKAGLWSQTVHAQGVAQTMKMCVDAASLEDAQYSGSQATKDMCSEQRVTPTTGGWSFHSVCRMGQGGTVTSDGTATGNGDGYRMDITSTTTGSAMAQANGVHKMSLDAKWEGPCPANMRVGDVQLPGGMTINPAAMKAGAMPRGMPGK